ncbi:hypothetical protein DL767_011476 [Monosporascus sp. MG133]|nr:hypothetical protein DL767_011476 [Monosporascus sp. MG133]
MGVGGNGAGMGMGGGQGSGPAGGQDMTGGVAHGPNHPHATEYTLQGVMRFLQTEWHRHERDRNAWEIERQEMKGRIAALEGSARRADATQKALKRYVAILEKKVKDQAAQLKGAKSAPSSQDATDHSVKQPPKIDRAALIQEKLKSTQEKPKEIPGLEGILGERAQEDEEREHLKAFLDQCQAEFTYLMITPANPMPPRESPPLPTIDDLREGGEAFGLPTGQQPLDVAFQGLRLNQNHVKEQGPRPVSNANTNHHAQPMPQVPNSMVSTRNADLQSAPMMRTTDSHPSNMYPHSNEWPAPGPAPSRGHEEPPARLNHTADFPRTENAEGVMEKRAPVESDAWDFGEGSFPDPASSQAAQNLPHRPDTDVFPTADNLPKSPHRSSNSHRRKTSMSRRKSIEHELSLDAASQKADSGSFKLRFGLRGHLGVVRTVIFSGGGSPGEPEICTAGDDGLVKRFHIPRDSQAHMGSVSSDLDVPADFTHRGHTGAALCLTAWSPSPNFSTGGRAQGDGWIFSGGQDATIRVWERGRVDPKATLEGHTNAVWAICVLPATLGAVFGQSNPHGNPDRILLVSGAADGAVKVWAVSAPPQLTSPQPAPGGRRATGSGGRARGNSMSSGSQFPNSPQPNMASNSPFNSTLVHDIRRANGSTASPTSIFPLSTSGEAFVVSYADAAIVVYDTRTGEEIGSMASLETYDGTLATSVNAVVATTAGLDQGANGGGPGEESGPTGGPRMAGSGVEGTIISGHEDRFIRFFDANSGQCTYNMLAHPAAISSLSLSPDGRELVSAGHDASLRFWSLEKRTCTQEITAHRVMRGEGVCAVVWSHDGRWVVSGGGDGIVKVFTR